MAHVTHDHIVAKIGKVGQAHRHLSPHMHTIAGHVAPAVQPASPPVAPATTPKGN